MTFCGWYSTSHRRKQQKAKADNAVKYEGLWTATPPVRKWRSTDTSPAFGMIGTVIGLVAMMANMDDPKAIGPAMAAALLTTLGMVLANVFFARC